MDMKGLEHVAAFAMDRASIVGFDGGFGNRAATAGAPDKRGGDGGTIDRVRISASYTAPAPKGEGGPFEATEAMMATKPIPVTETKVGNDPRTGAALTAYRAIQAYT